MSDTHPTRTVGALPDATSETPRAPVWLTRLVWTLWAASVGLLGAHAFTGATWGVPGVVAFDGLSAVMWVAVTFFSGIVHSYSRRYMAGSERITAFFVRIFAFTLVVLALVAAANTALFTLAWLAMGLLMADLVGYAEGWPQAQTAASLSRKYFLASSALVGVAAATLWATTGASTFAGVAAVADTLSPTVWLVVAASLLLAAMIQSALVPFQGWLLSSMTAPTPASALMHAGFVNAGGILLVRFAPVVTAEAGFMLLIVAVGAASALLGKLLRTVQTDVKGRLGCSTTGQMSFMLMQAGLGFFAAAITHLILHGFYKAYEFLSNGSGVSRTAPGEGHGATPSLTAVGALATGVTAVAGGVLFAVLTGEGLHADSGLLLAGLVVLTTLHAARQAIGRAGVSPAVRYGAVALVFLPAIAVYGLVYGAIEGLLAGSVIAAAPTDLTAVHVAVAAAFAAVYLAIETGVYRRSTRLYVALRTAGRPDGRTVLTNTEAYDEY
ncbi:NAD(P)H-quinone oxidoreductase subunit 5 [Halarchaeum rubridurum]|uniref:NAD(P)H-quinone oxidoreductase subunit 5 n=1 Tax=Halarchaeum rubridurum TaxID=489911 RepID=A0A830FY21_9EURY|nr:proton-conducting transporter membrane subunit [Halarchaeum rubridurum]MBP1953528.1 NAD(P)H-quinone oxidoreductase subunit 5 [Halarchaeum rubridurum]GGM64549.1 NADH dehydrogenase [Halarchaeum rubridurum]